MPEVRRILCCPKVQSVVCDMCQFGLQDPLSLKPYRKRTRLVGTLQGLEALQLRCPGDHEHEEVIGYTEFGGKSIHRNEVAGWYSHGFSEAVGKLVGKHVKANQLQSRQRKLKQLGPWD